MEHWISANLSLPYHSFGNPDKEKTKQLWIVCHGYGQLAKYFIRRFDVLDPDQHYVVAPEGISKFYLGDDYKKVGASWMTKENRLVEIENQWILLDKIFEEVSERINIHEVKLNLFGFSQGASTIARWMIKRQLSFDRLILWAGSFPPEITSDQTDFIKKESQLIYVFGKADPLINPDNKEKLFNLISKVFQRDPELIAFEGGHEVKREIIKKLSTY